MKKKFILGLFILITLFTITGCGNKSNNSSKKNSSNGIATGTFTAFKTVQCVEEGCSPEATEEEIKQEGWTVTLEVRSNKTATFTWKDTKNNNQNIVNFTIKNNKMFDDETGDEYSYSYVNGVITIEDKDGTSWSFK